MNELSHLPTSIVASELRPADPAARRAPTIEGNTTRAKTPTIGPKDTVEQALALTKLNRSMASQEPPRTDVPRGYYLDITV